MANRPRMPRGFDRTAPVAVPRGGMGAIHTPEPALVVLSVLFSDPAMARDSAGQLPPALGGMRAVSGDAPFQWTDYYRREMGEGLQRRFLAAERLAPQDSLADLKRLTNRIEDRWRRPDGTRRVNLDPGLLTQGNFVLASTKNNTHRLYLRDGIFAEVTLRFIHGGFEPLPWTYPDYASEEVRALLASLREGYRSQLHGAPVIADANGLRTEGLS